VVPAAANGLAAPTQIATTGRVLTTRVSDQLFRDLRVVLGDAIVNGPYPCTDAGEWIVMKDLASLMVKPEKQGQYGWLPKLGKPSGTYAGLSWNLCMGCADRSTASELGFRMSIAGESKTKFVPTWVWAHATPMVSVGPLSYFRLPDECTFSSRTNMVDGYSSGGYTFMQFSQGNWGIAPQAAVAEAQLLMAGRPATAELSLEVTRRLRTSLKSIAWGEEIGDGYCYSVAMWIMRQDRGTTALARYVPAMLKTNELHTDIWMGDRFRDYVLDKTTWSWLTPSAHAMRPYVQGLLVLLAVVTCALVVKTSYVEAAGDEYAEASLFSWIPTGIRDPVELPGVVLFAAAEEVLKKVHPLMVPAVILAELLVHPIDRYWPALCIHIASIFLPIHVSVILHSTYNIALRFTWQSTSLVKVSPYEDAYIKSTKDVCVCEMIQPPFPPIAPDCSVRMDGLPHCNKPPRPSVRFVAVRVAGVITNMYRSCQCNELAAIRHRVTVDEIKDNPLWKTWFKNARRVGPITVPTLQVWMERLTPKQFAEMQRIIGSTEPVDKVIDAFVKRELAAYEIEGCMVKEVLKPRLIQGRRPPIRLATGPSTYAYGKKLSEVYHWTTSNLVYAAGMTGETLGAWYNRTTHTLCRTTQGVVPYWVSIDCSRWDSTVGSGPLSGLHEDYKKSGMDDDALYALRDRDKKRRGKTASGIRYSSTAKVASGDGDTSCGNSRIHLVMLENCPNVKAAVVMGDDGLILTDDAGAVMRQYRAGGMIPVLSPDIDFCSQLLWPVRGGGHVLGPKIGRVLAKTFQCRLQLNEAQHVAWLRSVCLGIHPSCSFVPLLRALVPRLLALVGENGPLYDTGEWAEKLRAMEFHELSVETWEFFEDRYHIGRSVIQDLENEIRNMPLGAVLTRSEYVRMVSRDLLGF